MANHLGHSIPWRSTTPFGFERTMQLMAPCATDTPSRRTRDSRVMQHFADVFAAQIAEFAKTDKSTAEEKQPYDASKWDSRMLRGAQGHLGVQTSLICGYIASTCCCSIPRSIVVGTLIDPDSNWALQNCCGLNDGGHPEWIAAKFNRLFTAKTPLLEPDGPAQSWLSFVHMLDAEATTLIQDQCKCYFRALSTLSGLDHETTPEHILTAACWFLL